MDRMYGYTTSFLHVLAGKAVHGRTVCAPKDGIHEFSNVLSIYTRECPMPNAFSCDEMMQCFSVSCSVQACGSDLIWS
jgi:hypothetical protein